MVFNTFSSLVNYTLDMNFAYGTNIPKTNQSLTYLADLVSRIQDPSVRTEALQILKKITIYSNCSFSIRALFVGEHAQLPKTELPYQKQARSWRYIADHAKIFRGGIEYLKDAEYLKSVFLAYKLIEPGLKIYTGSSLSIGEVCNGVITGSILISHLYNMLEKEGVITRDSHWETTAQKTANKASWLSSISFLGQMATGDNNKVISVALGVISGALGSASTILSFASQWIGKSEGMKVKDDLEKHLDHLINRALRQIGARPEDEKANLLNQLKPLYECVESLQNIQDEFGLSEVTIQSLGICKNLQKQGLLTDVGIEKLVKLSERSMEVAINLTFEIEEVKDQLEKQQQFILNAQKEIFEALKASEDKPEIIKEFMIQEIRGVQSLLEEEKGRIEGLLDTTNVEINYSQWMKQAEVLLNPKHLRYIRERIDTCREDPIPADLLHI